jgi:hypothetical protein
LVKLTLIIELNVILHGLYNQSAFPNSKYRIVKANSKFERGNNAIMRTIINTLLNPRF